MKVKGIHRLVIMTTLDFGTPKAKAKAKAILEKALDKAAFLADNSMAKLLRQIEREKAKAKASATPPKEEEE